VTTTESKVVHHISVKMGAGYNLLTVPQFMALPINERVQLVLQKKIQFLDDHGTTIPVSDGLNFISNYKPPAK
jgi:hypothetical protein